MYSLLRNIDLRGSEYCSEMSHGVSHDVRGNAWAMGATLLRSQSTSADMMTESIAERFPDVPVGGLDFAFDPLDNFEDLCAELDTGATTAAVTAGSPAIRSAAAADIAPTATPAPPKKKQRNLVNARNAQRRFRERQKACVNAG